MVAASGTAAGCRVYQSRGRTCDPRNTELLSPGKFHKQRITRVRRPEDCSSSSHDLLKSNFRKFLPTDPAPQKPIPNAPNC
eukprot:1781838-Amphidinium_carterae.1